MTRRLFLKVAATVGVIALPVAAWFASHPACVEPTNPRGIQKMFGNCQQVISLGEAYLEQFPAEEDVALLESLVDINGPPGGLDELIRRDFATGDTVKLQGWVLSRTEGRQSALFSLL